MALQKLEARVLGVVEHVLGGGTNEDTLVECKSKFPADTGKAARQLGALANSARGADVLWIVGLDEKAHEVVGATDEVSTWWSSVVSSFDDRVAPGLTTLVVPTGDGKQVVALEFVTERAPYVVKNPTGGGFEREVPWREGNRTRSAHRHELFRILVPVVPPPELDVISARCVARHSDVGTPSEHVDVDLRARVFFGPPGERAAILPLHRASLSATFETDDWNGTELPTIAFADVNAWTVEMNLMELFNRGARPPEPPIDPNGVTVRRGSIYIGGGGTCTVSAGGVLPPHLRSAVGSAPSVTIAIALPVGGGGRPVETILDLLSVPLSKEEAGQKHLAASEAVKAFETSLGQAFCMSASWGSLIQATTGSFGGVGRAANRDGLAA